MFKVLISSIILLFAANLAYAETLVITSPSKNDLWVEGQTYEIRWETNIKKPVCITILTGGKDRGIINNCDTPADKGEYKFKVPKGFVTGFGISADNLAKVGICLKDQPLKCFYSHFFTISGIKPTPRPPTPRPPIPRPPAPRIQ